MYCSRCGTQVQKEAKFCPSCGLDLAATTPLAALNDLGDRSETQKIRAALQGEYEILEELGRGGMAIVYRALEVDLERDVAIKVLPSTLTFDAEFVQRFQREAKTSAQLEHPNIIPIYRVGESSGVIFFVMKFLRGESLSERIESSGKLSPDEIRQILIEAAQALGYANAQDVVHRDIKPDNIMFDEHDRPIVTDFGIAKAASGSRLTGTGMSIGTPHYMSPEQARAQPLDGRSDMYSLGVVAYQCLTGEWPFDGEDSFAIGYKHIMEDVPEPPMRTADERALFEIIRRMMAKSPDDRYQDAGALVKALKRSGVVAASSDAVSRVSATAAPRGSGSPSATGSPSPTPTTPVPAVESTFRPRRPPKQKRSGFLVGMFLLILLGGSGAGGYWYFVLDAQWPIPFIEDLRRSLSGTAPVPTDSLTTAQQDSAVSADSILEAVDRTPVPASAPTADLPNSGTLVVSGLPPGSRLMVDGDTLVGDTFQVDAGSHVIQAERLGYERFQRTIRVGRGETTVLEVVMTRLPQREATPAPQLPPRQPADVCSRPGPDYNRDNICFETPPRVASGVPLVSVPEGVTTTPTSVVLWVKVRSGGQADSIFVHERSSVPQFTIAAVRYVQSRALTFVPAQKSGRPVDAWHRLLIAPRRNN